MKATQPISGKIRDYAKSNPGIAISALLFAAYVIFFKRNIIVYLSLLISSAVVHYYLYRRYPVMNLGHIYFIAFIIDWHDGIAGEIFFIFLSGLLPELAAGYFEVKTIFSYILMFAVISIPVHLLDYGLVTLGIISSLVYFSLLFAISAATKEPIPERFFEVIAPAGLNILYFYYLANPLIRMLDFVLL